MLSKLLIVVAAFMMTVNAQLSPFMSVKEMQDAVETDVQELLGNFESDSKSRS